MTLSKQTLMIGVGTTTLAGGGVGAYFLAQDRTIGQKIVSEGGTLINDNDEYEVAFMENRDKPDLISAITTPIKEITASSVAKDGGKALKIWCEKQLAFDLSKKNLDTILPMAKKYCIKPSSTIEERYKKANKRLVTQWNTRLNTLKTPQTKDNSLQSDLGLSSLETSENNNVETALKNWCNTSIKTQLSQDKTDALWTKVLSRCLENA